MLATRQQASHAINAPSTYLVFLVLEQDVRAASALTSRCSNLLVELAS